MILLIFIYFLDFILLDYTTRQMKDKYKISYKTIKDIVIVFIDKTAEIMKSKHLLNEKNIKIILDKKTNCYSI